MRVVLGSSPEGESLRDAVAQSLLADGHSVETVEAGDFIELARLMYGTLLDDPHALGLAFDSHGVGTYMAATKFKGMVAANISEERSAYMTREHNDCRLVCMGSVIVGTTLAASIAREFVRARYSGGRHQVRVDMLAKMG